MPKTLDADRAQQFYGPTCRELLSDLRSIDSGIAMLVTLLENGYENEAEIWCGQMLDELSGYATILQEIRTRCRLPGMKAAMEVADEINKHAE